MVVVRSAGAYLTAPVKAEAYLVKLLAVAADVVESRLLWMLSRLYGILLCRKTVSVVAHRVEDIEALQALEACIDVTGDISQRMTDMKSRSRRVREHVEHIKFLLVLILADLVGVVLHPFRLPFFLDFSEVIFHCFCFVVFALRLQKAARRHTRHRLWHSLKRHIPVIN